MLKENSQWSCSRHRKLAQRIDECLENDQHALVRSQVLQEALTWLGTPYMKNECMKDVGVDCVAFVIKSFIDAGLPIEMPEPQGSCVGFTDHRMLDWLQALGAKQVPLHETKPADIIIWLYGGTPHHSGLIFCPPMSGYDGWVMHSCATRHQVILHPLVEIEEWGRRLDSCWSIKSVLDQLLLSTN